MTAIVVQKYGGSSVADVAGIQRVAARIAATRRAGKQVCVVVSAMGKTTDELMARARQISDAPSRRELDMLLTCGERASMALLSMAVSEQGYEAISFTGSQSGILTNDRHSGARIIEIRPIRVADELDRGKVVIVAGFQGVSYKREITTLGRGGSDTTAVALAGALGAEYCEICSDVDGVYSADPRVVTAAELIGAISHDEMLELATHGAKVLHAEAVEFARRSDIALYARATAGDGPGTRVDRVGAGDARIAGVAGQKRLVRLRARGGGVGAAALTAAREAGLALLNVRVGPEIESSSQTNTSNNESDISHPVESVESVEMWFALDDVPDWAQVRGRLRAAIEGAGATADIAEGHGAVSVVGLGRGGDPATLLAVTGAASELGVAIAALSTSPLRATAFVAEADVDRLVQALHRNLVEAG